MVNYFFDFCEKNLKIRFFDSLLLISSEPGAKRALVFPLSDAVVCMLSNELYIIKIAPRKFQTYPANCLEHLLSYRTFRSSHIWVCHPP